METGHEIITTTILSLLLIQAEQFSVTGEKMSIKYRLSSRNSLDKLSGRLDKTLVVDLAVNQASSCFYIIFIKRRKPFKINSAPSISNLHVDNVT